MLCSAGWVIHFFPEEKDFNIWIYVLRGEQDMRRADPFASFIQRRGYKTSKVHSVANRNNTGKTKSNPRASVGRRSVNNIQQGKAKG